MGYLLLLEEDGLPRPQSLLGLLLHAEIRVFLDGLNGHSATTQALDALNPIDTLLIKYSDRKSVV